MRNNQKITLKKLSQDNHMSLTMLPLIPISALIGISVPLFLGVVLTKPLYVYLEKINIGEIIKRVETEEDEE